MTDSTGLPRLAALAVLGLPTHASASEITQAYRRLAKTTHPDVTGRLDQDAGRRFAALTDAYDALTTSSPTPAESVPLRRPVSVPVRLARPPITAGPVRITPPSPTWRRSP